MPTHNLIVDSEQNNQRLDIYLAHSLSDVPSRTFVKKLIDNGHVKVNERVLKAHHRVVTGDNIIVDIPDDFLTPQYIEPENIPLDIFYEDEFLLVINKPSGLLVHPAQGNYSGTLVNALLNHSLNLSDVNSEIRPGIVHRLDQDTSGLILIAKDNITHTKLAKQFQRHEIQKQYIALVEGSVEFDQGKIDAPIGDHFKQREKKTVRFDDEAKDCLTYYQVIKRTKEITYVLLYPQTGRTHQLRVHMAYLGHPILGDEKYGHRSTFPRLALHAQAISFRHPMTKKYVEFCSKPPQEFLSKISL